MLTLEAIVPLRPRTQTGDLDVQLHHDDGAIHRPAIGGKTTACGLEIVRYSNHVTRSESYEGYLCLRGCFSDFELERNRELTDAKKDE